MSVRLITRSIWQNPGNRGSRLRKTLNAVAWQVQKRSTKSVHKLRLANGAWFNAYPDCVISSSLIYSEWPEYDELCFVRRVLRQGDVVIDVGANVGHISLLLSDIVAPADVVAFEPAPGAFRRLVENWQLNNFPTNNLFKVAVGATPGEVFIAADEHPTTTLRVSVAPEYQRMARVQLVQLDDYRELWAGRAIGLVKVDVEGYESEVFTGAHRLLAEDRPRLLMFESLSGRLDARLSTLFEQFRYSVFEIGRDGRPDFARCTAQNLFASPQEILGSSPYQR